MNTKIIKLDINNKMYETITAKQGDTESRFLLFHLFDSSLPFDLTEKSVRVYGIKPDETKIFNDLVINDVKKGYCTLELTNQMLAISGLVKLELVIYSGNKKLSSIPFVLNVISSLNSDDAVVSTNEFTALMNGLAALSEYDIYKSNAKQVPGIKEEVSNLSSQLDTIETKIQQPVSLDKCDEEMLVAIQNKEGESTFNLLSIPRDNSVTIGKMAEDFRKLGDYTKSIEPTEIKEGYYNVTNGSFVTLSGWNTSIYDVIEGELYKYKAYSWEAVTGTVVFLSSSGNMLSYLNKGTGSEKLHEGEFIVPKDCTKVALFGRLKTPTLIKFICYDFEQIKETTKKNKNTIENSLNYYDLDVKYQNGYYNKNTGVLFTSPNYDMQYVDISVKTGEKFSITCAINEAITAGIIFKNSEGGIISTYLNGDGTNKTYEDYEIEVPENAFTMCLTSRLSFGKKGVKKKLLSPPVEEKGDINDIYLKMKSSSMYETDIMFKYSKTNDMMIKILTGGVNGLLTTRYFYLIENELDWCCGDFTKEQALMKNVYSDMIGPIRARAVNNADGNEETAGKFVGGWHGTVTNNKPSARLDSVKFFIDDKEVTGTVGIYKGKEVRIEYLNYLQGWNTTNSTGTGREILTEKVTMRITRGKIDVVNELTALEDVILGDYYGIQTENGSAWNDEILFLCDGVCKRKDFTVDYDCPEKTDYIICRKDEHYITAYMKDCGLGRLKYNKSCSRKAHSRSYKKAYFDLIVDSEEFTLNTGDSVWWNGGYIFSYDNYKLF